MNAETVLPESQVRALLSLIADESPGIRETCTARVRRLGMPCLPWLREQALSTAEPALRSASIELASTILLDKNLALLRGSIRAERPVLEAGCIAIAQIANPLVEPDGVRDTLDAWADELRPGIGPACSLIHAVERMRQFATNVLRLRGNVEFYGDPRNSLMDQVLERRLGIPITLSAIWLLLSRRLGVPLHGLGIPSHFLVGFHHEGMQHFIDPFHGGRLLENAEVTAIIKSNHLPIHPAYFRPIRDVDMLFRMTNNLVAVLKNDDPGRWLAGIQRLRKLITEEERP
ncbi:MAG: hypothetical protein H6834_16615 [Planctomycetes bacterium]|nr:hypothetical protein [Planctomycetota bacterium]